MKKNLIWRWAWREIWQGQLWPVFFALSLIIACMFALSALAGRIESAMTQQGRSMLAADLVLETDSPLSPELETLLTKYELDLSKQTQFQTMAFSDNEMRLVKVKAVESNYPLRGELVLVDDKGEHHAIKPKELWLAERLFDLLDVKIGDQVEIGNSKLTVSGKIETEPELSFNPFNQMPAVMIHASDLDMANVVRPGNRVGFRYFFKGDDSELSKIKTAFPENESWRWLDENTNDRTGDILTRTRDYLSLTTLLVIIMAAATLQLTCRHYVESRRPLLGMLKSIGASKKWLAYWLGLQLTLLFTGALVLGLACGLLFEYFLRLPLVDILPSPLPTYGFAPWIIAPAVALFVALPAMGIPLNQLINIPALSVFQPNAKKKGVVNFFNVSLIGIPAAALIIFAYDNSLLWIVLAILSFMLVFLALIGIGFLNLLQKKIKAPAMVLALSRITRNKIMTGVQLGALATSLMLLVIIWLMQKDLLQDWRQTLPDDVPNVFALNIEKDELTPYLSALDEQGLLRSEAFPISRGRLVAKNDERFSDIEPDESKRDNALRREINFTWRSSLPDQNLILEGDWEKGGVSVEEGIADRLGISLGDELTFVISDQEFKRKVTSIREVEWRNMRPNFFFIFKPEEMQDFPATWLVSFRLDDKQSSFLNKLARDFPTVSLLDLRQMGEKLQVTLNQINTSLSMLAGLAVLSGLLLILTLLRLSLAERQKEIVLYRTLGASKKQITRTLWAEYGLMALVSGFIAVIGGEIAIAALFKWGLELPAQLHPQMWLIIPLLALCLVYLTVFVMLKRLLIPLTR